MESNRPTSVLLAACLAVVLLTFAPARCEASLMTAGPPLRVLLVTGGCWHNYTRQTTALKSAFAKATVPVAWTVVSASCANAVVIHCAMHSFRDATVKDWRYFLGVSSYDHELQARYRVRVVERYDPAMNSYPGGHRAALDELYVVDRVLPATRVLAYARSVANGREHPVFWKNFYGRARVFGTTFGHSDQTFQDSAFTNTVIRGALWASGRLL
eukprot:IDg15956t1